MFSTTFENGCAPVAEAGWPKSPAGPGAPAVGTPSAFWPRAARDFGQAGLSAAMVESLTLKYLLNVGLASGRLIARELGLPFLPFPDLFRNLQTQKIVACTNVAAAGDFDYVLTEVGRARAKVYLEECSYIGTAPVPYTEYAESVLAQSLSLEQPRERDLRRAFSDLLVPDEMLAKLGPAITSGRGMFLFGLPGNGKTSIAERITRCFGTTIWIPRVLDFEGQIVKLFDQASHEEVPFERSGRLLGEEPDGRWVRIKRPTIVAGGELTMDNLEIRHDHVTRVGEAPLQLKSNNGTFLIDDFGRQRMSPAELLNRWIVPLEKRHDYLAMANGKKVRVPFDQLILFSTNLEPSHLVDEAFLRRIPYKIRVEDPTEPHFRQMFATIAPKLGFETFDPAILDDLIERHYRAANRPFRSCHPRDLLLQVRNYCLYQDLPLEISAGALDFAVENYFACVALSG